MPQQNQDKQDQYVSKSNKFHSLMIKNIQKEAVDAISISFEIPKSLAQVFKFIPGQHLTLKTLIDGQEVRRSYSICGSSCGENSQLTTLQIAIKKIDAGVFSHFAHTFFKKGQTLEVMPPLGHFYVEHSKQARHYLGIVAGSGITPMISIIENILKTEPKSRFTLFFGNRDRHHILFADRLDVLKNTYLERFALYHFLTQESQEIELFNGRLSDAKIAAAIRLLIPKHTLNDFPMQQRAVFICGPNKMIDAGITQMKLFGLSEQQIHFERFGTPEYLATTTRKQTLIEENKNNQTGDIKASIILDGVRREINVAPTQTILEAGIAAGMDLPYSCQGGVCCTCRAKVLSGALSMIKNYALGQDELENGYILTCQAIPTSAEVVLSFDE